MPVFDLSTGKVMHIPRGKSLVQKFNPKTGRQEYHYEDGWGNRYDVPKFEDAPKKAQEIMKAMKAHFDSKDSKNSEDSKYSGDVKEIQEDSKNSNDSKDDVKTSEDVKKVDSEDSKDSEDVKSSDSEISENSEYVKKTSDSEGSGDSGDSDSEYKDFEGSEEIDSEDSEADMLRLCEELKAEEGFELDKVKTVFDEKSKNEKAEISKNRAPITIFDHILIFTLLFVFAGILTVTGYSDDVFKWIHDKTGISWQTFGGKNWIQ